MINKNNNVVLARLDEQGRPVRQIRSFVRRQGRLTTAQSQALTGYWGKYGIDFKSKMLNFPVFFGRESPIIVEIGFGMGDALIKMAKAFPDYNFLAIDVYLPGVGACLANVVEYGLTNVRLICHDAVEVFEFMIADASLSKVQLFFPDPWHKAHHHKRRIVQTAFAELILKKLQVGSVFHLATDWENYAEHMLHVMNAIVGYQNLSATQSFVPRPDERPLTKFEKRGHRLGHSVWDLMFKKMV